MQKIEKPFEIRDQRSRHMFRMDDAYLDSGYSAICGQTATCIYMSLCRHADSNQESYPSMQRLMEQHGVSKPTVIKAIKALEGVHVIKVERKKDPKTKRQMVNVYVLLDKSEWAKPGKDSLPRAGSISEVEPGKENMQKPGKPDLPEGYTKRSIHIEGSGAQSAPAPVCVEEGCGKPRMKGVEHCTEHEPMTVSQFVGWYRRSPSRHMLIIAEWADELRQCGMAPDLRTVAQWSTWAKTIMTAAKALEIFQDEQIAEGIKRMMAAEWTTDFNLHTVKSFILNSKKK